MSEYNGWTNYETWQCALWLDNDAALASITCSCAGADDLQAEVHDYLLDQYEAPASLLGDIVNAWIREVDFEQIVLRANEA